SNLQLLRKLLGAKNAEMDSVRSFQPAQNRHYHFFPKIGTTRQLRGFAKGRTEGPAWNGRNSSDRKRIAGGRLFGRDAHDGASVHRTQIGEKPGDQHRSVRLPPRRRRACLDLQGVRWSPLTTAAIAAFPMRSSMSDFASPVR